MNKNNENTVDVSLLEEIFPTPSNTMRTTELTEPAPCNGVCNGGTCQGY